MYFIGAIIVLCGLYIGCFLKAVPFSIFVNVPAIVVIFFTMIGIIVATSSFKTFIRGLNAIFSAKYAIDDAEREKAAGLFRLLSKAVIMASFAIFVIGGIATLGNMSDPEKIAHAFISALISIAGGMTVSFAFLEPAACVLRKPRVKPTFIKEYPKHLGDHLLELCSQNGLTPEDIQNATGIELRR